MAKRDYARLARARPRSGFRVLVSRCSLWLGKDHVLSVETSGYIERYRRFYFNDIQAVLIRRTNAWKGRLLVLPSFAGLCALAAVLSSLTPPQSTDRVAVWVFGILAAVLALLALPDIIGGPSCICHVRTAVQTEEWPSLNRVRRARRVLARLRPLILQTQGELSSEQLREGAREFLAANMEAGSTPPQAAAEASPGPPQSVS